MYKYIRKNKTNMDKLKWGVWYKLGKSQRKYLCGKSLRKSKREMKEEDMFGI